MVLGDGAEWIWNLTAEQFPGAIEIVDLYYAKRICPTSPRLDGAGTDLAARWGKALPGRSWTRAVSMPS
ncbi:MAG: hypothetical protein OXH52_06750 [Gammaproteobacteria bacterium]|nr:hypothetical protein [Gammaproteobacteria bacterium]